MSTHTVHKDIHEAGLADECERCAEQAEHPLESLDDTSLRYLVENVNANTKPRSENEAIAMRHIERAMNTAGRLLGTASFPMSLFLERKWHLKITCSGPWY